MGNISLKETIYAARQGNEEAKLNLVEKYKPLVNKYSLKFNIKDFDKDDLKQEANIAILKSIEKFNLSLPTTSFDGYAINAIKNTLNYIARKEIKRNTESSLNAQADGGDEIVNLLQDSIDIENDHITNLTNEKLSEALKTLSEEKRQLIYGIYFADKPNLSRYCREHNLNYVKTRRILLAVLSELKNFMG